MKKLIFITFTLFVIFISSIQSLELEQANITENTQSNQIENVESGDWDDKLKAIKCLMKSKEQIIDIVKLIKDIVDGQVAGSIKDIYRLLKRLGDIFANCKVLVCYGPSFKKCREQNPGNECELTGKVVYPKCSEGYVNWGCCVCANFCPEKFHDDGLHCRKPSSYGRGAGYPLWQEDKCKKQNSQGCEKNGALWYPKCAQQYHNVGCCVCSPDCPNGWTDIGISCRKPSSYGRGVGYPVTVGLQCLEDLMQVDSFMTCDQQKIEIDSINMKVKEFIDNIFEKFDKLDGDFLHMIKELVERKAHYQAKCE